MEAKSLGEDVIKRENQKRTEVTEFVDREILQYITVRQKEHMENKFENMEKQLMIIKGI